MSDLVTIFPPHNDYELDIATEDGIQHGTFSWRKEFSDELMANWNKQGTPPVLIDPDKGIALGNVLGHIHNLIRYDNGAVDMEVEWLYAAKETILPQMRTHSFVPGYTNDMVLHFVTLTKDPYFAMPWQQILEQRNEVG